jgi:hypothetical protein
MKRSIAKDNLYKAIGKGERTSHKVSYITKADGSRFRRENANQHGNAEGGNDYVENRPNRTDIYPKDRRKKIMKTGGKTPEEIAYEQEQEDAMFNSQYGKGSTVKGVLDKYYLVKHNKNSYELKDKETDRLVWIGDYWKIHNALQDKAKLTFSEADTFMGNATKYADGGGVGKYAKGSTVKGEYEKINKIKAKKLFDGGETVYLSNGSLGGSKLEVKKGDFFNHGEFINDFDEIVSDFKSYNKEIYYFTKPKFAKGSTVMGKYKKGGKTGCWCYEIGGL